MMPPKDGDYEVGYGKPPAHSRFRPGRSGNPKGRPQGSQNVDTLMRKALAVKVTVTENGVRRRRTKLDIALNQLANKAASGDYKALRIVMDSARIFMAEDASKAAGSAHLSDADRKLLAEFSHNFSQLETNHGD